MDRRVFLSNSAICFLGYYFFPSGVRKLIKDDSTNISALNEVTIDQLQDYMKAGRYTSEQITRLYLNRIAQLDRKGPSLHAVIEINPDAIPLAKISDEERKKGQVRSLLHGVPILLKDNIDTADKMMTTAGSLALLNHKAKKDAFVAKKLREAGAIILGKTNLTEWANFRSTRAASGWSSRGGQTKNPYILDRTPCGSSSGSAVAVAANLCVVAVGTETNGSISCPAAMNSVVGIKPTIGLVSRSGVIPIAKTQDTAGPLARTVKDAAILLGVLAGKDANDAVTNNGKDETTDYTRFLNSDGLKGKTIGVEKAFLNGHEAITALLRKAIEQMRSQGANVVEVEFIEKYRQIGVEQRKVLQYEFKDGLNRYLASANAAVKSLADVIQFNKEHEVTVMPYFKQEIFESAQAKGSLEEKDYIQALAKYQEARSYYNKFFEDNKLDALCGPANGFPICIDLINGDSFSGYGTYGPAAVCGFPSITVPLGNVNDLPIGLSFLGLAYGEPKLISIGYAYEQVSKNRISPKFKKTFA